MGSCAGDISARGEGGTSWGTAMVKHSSLVSQLPPDPHPGGGVPTAELTSRPWGQRDICQRVPGVAELGPAVSPGTEQLQDGQRLCHAPPEPAPVTVPRTSRRALQRRVSAAKVTVPESSSASLSSVRLCPQPVALIRHVLLGFTRMPSRVQTPATPGWDSSRWKVAVSFSKVSTSASGVRIDTFRAARDPCP